MPVRRRSPSSRPGRPGIRIDSEDTSLGDTISGYGSGKEQVKDDHDRKDREQNGAQEKNREPRPRFTPEERRRLAEFFIILDRMDRANAARRQRKEAA